MGCICKPECGIQCVITESQGPPDMRMEGLAYSRISTVFLDELHSRFGPTAGCFITVHLIIAQ